MSSRSGSGPLEAFLDERIEAGEIPGAVWFVANSGGVVASGARGDRALEPAREPATLDTIYDLASLTKPVCTSLLLLQLVREEIVRLDDPAGRWIPRLAGTDKASLTVGRLAAHDSGLPAWHPLYVAGGGREGYVDQIARIPLAHPAGERSVYSDLGYVLLGEVIQAAAGETLDELFDRRIARPLKLKQTGFLPPASRRPRIAPTERDHATEREMVARLGLQYDGWRSGILRGDVHDANAWGLGGVAAHAGLFGTGEELIRIAREYLGQGIGLLNEASRALARAPRTREGEVRSAAWQLASTPGCAAEGVLPAAAMGHTGFTGTSLWLDPESGRTYVLLTNRVHPAKPPAGMNALRREFHRLASQIGPG